MNYEGINQAIDNQQIESLRLILERLHNLSFSHEDAEEVAESLLSFYDLLAKDAEPEVAYGGL